MHQNWGKLLFMHWPIDAGRLRPMIPARLEIDTYDDSAWIGVVPFTMWGIRASFAPPVPGLSALHELNIRTYVHLDGVPGVWFLSLDANSSIAVWTARTVFHLPYFNARINLDQQDNIIVYSATRTHEDAPSAEFNATWKIGDEMPETEPGTLAFFLTERYCLYSADEEKLHRVRNFHRPWPLQEASVSSYRSTMIESHGLPTPTGEPLLHYAEAIEVDFWPPESV